LTEDAKNNNSRRVDFDQFIQVFLFDQVAGDLVCCESSRLCLQSKDRNAFLNRRRFAQKQNGINDSSVEPNSRIVVSASDNILKTTKSIEIIASDMEYSFFEDSARRHWIKCIVSLGLHGRVSVDDILVRANMSGNRFRVSGSRISGSDRQVFNEFYTLPIDVDPYLISARLDPTSGRLLVEAPMKIC
jgi:hypothetical protein